MFSLHNHRIEKNTVSHTLVWLYLTLMPLHIAGAQVPAWFPNRNTASIGGYIEEIPLVMIDSGWEADESNMVHFRLNTRWTPIGFTTVEASGRFLLYSGSLVTGPDVFMPAQAAFSRDPGYVRLTRTWPSLLYATMDRAFAAVNVRNLNVTLGRQRINWGTNFVWNPNDWYNTYDYFDFAYPERPGTDALRVQYYTGATSVVEAALEAGKRRKNRTFALLYKFNRRAYDFQLQTGLFGLDGAAGFSWAGAIHGAGFRGEAAYFHPVLDGAPDRSVSDGAETIVAALSADYTFVNSLYVHGEFLYNGYGENAPQSDTASFISTLSAKNLFPFRYGIFGETAYQVTPLIRGNISGIVSPGESFLFLSPSVAWSLTQTVDLSLIAQFFLGDRHPWYGGNMALLAATAHWSF